MKKVLKSLICTIVILSMLLPMCVYADSSKVLEKTILYVAPNGNDSNDGSINAPFATFEKAQMTIRQMKKDGKIARDGAVVYFREGKYSILKGIEFTSEDSGKENAPITYRAYPGENVKFIGGVEFDYSKFQKVTDEEILNRIVDKTASEKIVYINLKNEGITEIPEPVLLGSYSYSEPMDRLYGPKPSAGTSELIVNGKAQTLSRYPNGNANIIVQEVVEHGATPVNWLESKKGSDVYVEEKDQKFTPFIVRFGDERIKNWTKAESLIMWGKFYADWADQSVYISKVNPDNLTVIGGPSFYGWLEDGNRPVYFYNLLEEIDIPGEYYIDKKTGNLYYYPLEEKIENVMLTTLEDHMFNLIDCDYVGIKDIEMTGMRKQAFQYDTKSDYLELEDLEISYTGDRAIVGNGNNARISNCYFHDCNGGISINGGDVNTLTPGNSVVENCNFENNDRLLKTYNPSLRGGGVGTILRFNKMSGSDHMIAAMNGNDGTFAFNEISDACLTANDMGAFYTGRSLSQRGNKMYYNYFHDIGNTTATENDSRVGIGTHAVFHDDYLSWWHMSGNIFENCVGGAVIQFAGSYNAAFNNIFINCPEMSVYTAASYTYGSSESDTFKALFQTLERVPWQSEVWQTKYPELKEILGEDGQIQNSDKGIVIKNNVLYNSGAIRITNNSVIEHGDVGNNISYKKDPGFYDMENGNYLLKRDADVYTKIPEFIEIPFTRIGLYTQRALDRVRKSGVFSYNSPYGIVAGEEKLSKNFVKDGILYVNLRDLAASVGGTVEFNEETGEISITSDAKMIKFVNGETSKVLVNNEEVTLDNGIISVDYSNCLALSDFAKIVGRPVLTYGDIVILAENENLFNNEADSELIRYYKDTMSVY